MISRRATSSVYINRIPIGSNHPIVIQSMTNTQTADVGKTVQQIQSLADAGSELVRVTINDEAAAKAIPDIIKILRDQGYSTPIIGDFHYNGHLLLTQFSQMAQLIDKYRINPGNSGTHFETIIRCAIDYQKPIRIGVNFGSLDKQVFTDLMNQNTKREDPLTDKQVIYEAMIQSALNSAEQAQGIGLRADQIILSAKVSDVLDCVTVNQLLANRCNYPLHIGLTEAGSHVKGLISSAAAIGILLQAGIGDTIRMSLTPTPGGSRTQEVEAAKELLQSMSFRFFKPTVTSCPGCGRTSSNFFSQLAEQINLEIVANMPQWRSQYPGIEQLKIAVMGCVVNGPGESRHADIGISLPGSGESSKAPVYIDGNLSQTISGENMPEQFITILKQYIHQRYSF